MTLLSHDELVEIAALGIIEGVSPAQINGSSIDVTLGTQILTEQPAHNWRHYDDEESRVVRLRLRDPLVTEKRSILEPYRLYPGHFILAQTQQVFNLPCDISAEYKLKSSMARIGLEHLNAGWCDAGWHGSVLTLELKNMTTHHIIELQAGDPIGQVVFFKHRPVKYEDSYEARGRYNNDAEVTPIKL